MKMCLVVLGVLNDGDDLSNAIARLGSDVLEYPSVELLVDEVSVALASAATTRDSGAATRMPQETISFVRVRNANLSLTDVVVWLEQHRSRALNRPVEANAKHSLTQMALAIVGQRFADSALRCRTIAAELGVTPEHLCRAIKKESGATFRAHLHRVRLGNAARLLLRSRLSIKEVAAASGFDRTSDLDRVFRKACAVSPGQYRLAGRRSLT